jgi:ribosome biogenesis GTPase / thiamine phosphate phosphatase
LTVSRLAPTFAIAYGILPLVKAGVAGVVTAVYGPLLRVQVEGDAFVVPLRRKLRWQEHEEDKRIVVGDQVLLEGRAPDLVVAAVEPRRTRLTRRSPGEQRSRVIAANVDQAIVVMAAVTPEPNPRFLDRLLVACHHASIQPIVCINKIDQGVEAVETWISDYLDAGYQVLMVSARTARGMGGLKRTVTGRTTLFCGPSGAGKSALVNAIHPGYRLREGSISEATGKGRHTTSTAQLLALPDSGFVVDTPGLKEFGLWDLAVDQLHACFPDIAPLIGQCQFGDCSHGTEETCAVRLAVESGRLSSRRYTSFLKLREELVDSDT